MLHATYHDMQLEQYPEKSKSGKVESRVEKERLE